MIRWIAVPIVEARQFPERFGGQRTMTSTFDPIQPMPWTA